MIRRSKFSPELRERAVRMVRELRKDHDSDWGIDHIDRLEGRVLAGTLFAFANDV